MDEFFIQWEKIDPASLNKDTRSDFFLFANNESLLFFGFAYEMGLTSAVRQAMESIDMKEADVTFWMGRFVKNLLNESCVDRQLAEEALCLLIFHHRPLFNYMCINQYHGRDSLLLQNRGCNLVLNTISRKYPVLVP